MSKRDRITVALVVAYALGGIATLIDSFGWGIVYGVTLGVALSVYAGKEATR